MKFQVKLEDISIITSHFMPIGQESSLHIVMVPFFKVKPKMKSNTKIQVSILGEQPLLDRISNG
jgi:hypothetical protein